MAKTKDAIDIVFNALNKKFKDTAQKSIKLSDLDTNSEFVSTGCTPLDIAISNRVNGGIPLGKITEIDGLNSAGKSLLLATILANNQKNGGISVFIDNEFAVEKSFYQAIGVDTDKLVYSNLEYIEDMLQAVEEIVLSLRESGFDKPIVVGLDSIAGAKTRSDASDDYEKGGYNTHKAIILSQKLPKIVSLLSRHNAALVVTQQLRTKLGISFGDPYTTASGGLAFSYFSSVIIRLTRTGKIKASNDLIVGIKTKATIEKTRLGPGYRKTEFEIYFDSGIDDFKACLDILKYYGVIKSNGAWSSWKEDLQLPNVDINKKFQNKDWREWMNNPEFYNAISHKIAELSIIKYKGFMGDEENTLVTDDDDENIKNIDDKTRRMQLLESVNSEDDKEDD